MTSGARARASRATKNTFTHTCRRDERDGKYTSNDSDVEVGIRKTGMRTATAAVNPRTGTRPVRIRGRCRSSPAELPGLHLLLHRVHPRAKMCPRQSARSPSSTTPRSGRRQSRVPRRPRPRAGRVRAVREASGFTNLDLLFAIHSPHHGEHVDSSPFPSPFPPTLPPTRRDRQASAEVRNQGVVLRGAACDFRFISCAAQRLSATTRAPRWAIVS